MKLLIVDDDLNTVEVLRDSIEWDRFGIGSVLIAFNGTGAQKVIREEAPEIVLCDIEMPCGNGLDLLKWIRAEKLETEFIFLTCHENFDFAARAIEYGAIGYVTKPFQAEKTITAVCKAARRVSEKKLQAQYSEYGKSWLDLRQNIEENFWRDVLSLNIQPTAAAIAAEIRKRRLQISDRQQVQLLLVSVVKSQIGPEWESGSFQYALRNLCAEAVFGEPNMERAIVYDTAGSIRVILPVDESKTGERFRERCDHLVHLCRAYLQCVVNCHISVPCGLANLAEARKALEQADRDTPAVNGCVMQQGEAAQNTGTESPALDFTFYTELLESGNQLKAVTCLKGQLEQFAESGVPEFNSVYQDFTQILFSVLNHHEIQAHRVFEDDTSKALARNAVQSLFDMMKWANYASHKVVEVVDQTRRSENVVERAKDYIRKNYARHIGRNEIAACVYLTPDYLSKLFKEGTGLSLNDYLNRYRIRKASELLADNSRSVSDIAMQVGFDNISYFSTVYKKFTGNSPNELRKKRMFQ